jgi:hypothetical protein
LSNKGLGKRATYPYILCGWHIHSEIPLTCVPRAVFDADHIDVVIQIAHEPSPIKESSKWLVVEHSAELSRIRIDAIADFEVRSGKLITVWPAPRAALNDIEIVLSGPVWATLCHQRGLLPLHASAILGDGGIAAFAGRSGVGKSTTAALMNALDYPLFADDILPIAFNEHSEPGAWPYLRRLKLRKDSILKLALTPAELVSERLDEEKYFVVPKCAADNRWSRLERLYVLENDTARSGNSIERIVGAEAVRALVDQTFHRDFVEVGRQYSDHLAFCAKLSSKVAVYRLRRSVSEAEKEFGSLIRAHFEITEGASC